MGLIVEERRVVRLGDSTTHGGKVVQVASRMEVDGRRIARVGDKVVCPRCQSIHRIVEGEKNCLDDGIPIALHGHRTSCGASLISSVRGGPPCSNRK